MSYLFNREGFSVEKASVYFIKKKL